MDVLRCGAWPVGSFHYRVLVVDDDERILRVSSEILAHTGKYEVQTGRDGFEALVLLRKALPDVIISDLKMPGMSGFELLSIVRRRFPPASSDCNYGRIQAGQ